MAVAAAIAVTNDSTVLQDAEVQAALPDFAHQCQYDFGPYWHGSARFVFVAKGSAVPAGAWHLSILDDSDQAGALGYHDVTPSNQPLMKVFAKTDQKYGLSWSVTASHEYLEALADPWVSAAWQVSNTQFYALEVGDPVEADKLGYKGPHGTLLSDFVLPAWFVPGLKVPKYSYRGHAPGPLKLTDGGYASIYTSGHGWGQVQQRKGELVPVELEAASPRFRDRSKGNPMLPGNVAAAYADGDDAR